MPVMPPWNKFNSGPRDRQIAAKAPWQLYAFHNKDLDFILWQDKDFASDLLDVTATDSAPAQSFDYREETSRSTATSNKEGKVKFFYWLSYEKESLLWEQTSQGSFVACLVHQMIPSWHCGCSNTQRFIHHQVLGTGKQKRGVRRNFTNCISLLLGLLPAGRKYNRLIKFQ